MTKREPMICPDCGVAMNLHAEKLDYGAALSDPGAADPELGGVVEEAHSCPSCGKTAVRKAEGTN